MIFKYFWYNKRARIFKFLMFDCHLCYTPLKWLFAFITTSGIEFWYNGDEIIWLWPWRRRSSYKYISILASGNGEFGSAYFKSLKEIDNFWAEYEIVMSKKI